MGLESIQEQAEKLLKTAQDLKKPISDLPDGQWTRDVDLSAEQNIEARDLGTVKLKGDVKPALFVTQRAAAPEFLDAIEPEPEENEHAVTSTVLTAKAGASLHHEQSISAGVGVKLGAEVAASLAVGQHRRYDQSISALEALKDHLTHLRNPYQVKSLESLIEGELFAVELSGSGQLAASAGWKTGLVRSFEGTNLNRLSPGDLGEINAGITAAVTVTARVEGELRILVDKAPRRSNMVRVRLFRKRGNFVGAGLKITAQAKLTQEQEFVEAALGRLLKLPDGLVAKAEDLEDQLKSLQTKLNSLSQESRDEIAKAADVVADALGLDDLNRLVDDLDNVPALAPLLEPFKRDLQELQTTIDESETEILKFVSEDFKRASAPLDHLAAAVESWLDGYRQARQKSLAFLVERAKEGITAELTAGINRTATSETLLELDFVLETAGLLCLETLKGNFAPALERAQAPGATGVEIVSGTLKSETKTERFYNLRLNLFGFEASVDFRRFEDVAIETDTKTGVMSISGKAGATIDSKTKHRVNELSFLFDIYGGFERRGDTLLTSPQTDFKASIVRSAEFTKASRIRPLIERHIAGARHLRMIGEQREQELVEVLQSNPASTYSYEMRLDFPPSAINRIFGLDLRLKDKDLENRVWGWMRQAVAVMDLPIDHPGGDIPLSATFTDSTIEAVGRNPILSRGGRAPSAIRSLRFGGRGFSRGAQRQIFFYLRNAHFFVESYLRVRRHLREGDSLQRAAKTLSKIAARSVSGVGAIDIQPFDAKYLVFAFADGLREVDITMTVKRGKVEVTI